MTVKGDLFGITLITAMPQSQFKLQQGFSSKLDLFPQIIEFGFKKNNTIQLNSFSISKSKDLSIYYIIDGKFEWSINRKHYILLPGDAAIVIPEQEIGGSDGYLGIGSFFWLKLHIDDITSDGKTPLGEWSNLSASEKITICKVLLRNDPPVLKVKDMVDLFYELHFEIMNQEFGFVTRINHLLDSLFIVICREYSGQYDSRRDFPKTFLRLENALRQNLSHQWTVEEMAAMVGLGSTAFTEKVKNYSGFSPLQYLINLRVTEAIKLLKRHTINITEIALETGFYSSQHFSTTFKKLTGYTPGEYRKKH